MLSKETATLFGLKRRWLHFLVSKEKATLAATVENANACLGCDHGAGNIKEKDSQFLWKVKD